MLLSLDAPSIDVTMLPVTSTSISEYGYQAESKTLYVRFVHDRKLYSYANFPADLFDTMKRAPSVGKFFAQRIVKQYEGKFIKEVA